MHDTPLITSPALAENSDLAFTKFNEEKNSCRKNLFQSDFSSPSINEGMSSSLGSVHMSGSGFPVIKSSYEEDGCQNMLVQKGVDICGESSIRKTDIKKLDIRDEHNSIIEISDDTSCTVEIEDKFRCVKERGVEDFSQDTASSIGRPADCQINVHCQQDITG
ncbi:hypothetical protein KI387_021322 [Taxus chinensis]|uniref:Uncharacterized protein n=1 Tax=Taxus chinensis TaxID=29808 RepID=A0AA38GCV2_TAXCH|nr:hypothetical protein KI387_021322 [Taxus chinensis]